MAIHQITASESFLKVKMRERENGQIIVVLGIVRLSVLLVASRVEEKIACYGLEKHWAKDVEKTLRCQWKDRWGETYLLIADGRSRGRKDGIGYLVTLRQMVEESRQGYYVETQ